jgi:hypothetical protein
VGHGRFGEYVRKQCQFTDRTARNYMRIARSGVKTETVADLGMVGALNAIDQHEMKKEDRASSRAERKAHPQWTGRDKPKRKLKRKFTPAESPLERPRDSQVLQLRWDDESRHVAYVWREIGEYDFNSFAYIICHLKPHEAPMIKNQMVGEAKTDRKPIMWQEIVSRLCVQDWNPETRLSPYVLPDGARQEVWDADDTMFEVLRDWREQLLCAEWPRKPREGFR